MKKGLIIYLLFSILIFQILVLNSVDAQVFPGTTWQTKTPAEMGMDVNRLNELRDYVGGNGVVIRDGYLVYSWCSQSQRNDIASAVKPFYSHFLFEAVDSGLLTSIDQRINTFETCVNNINANLNYKDRSITFKQLANQISCYGVRENPGACFDYNDYNMALFFDTLFLRVYGATYSTVDSNVLSQRLGSVLQFQDNPTFLGTGQNFQMGRMNISVRDFARFGLLYMRDGRWNNQQLIRQQDAVMAVTSPLSLSIPRTTAVAAQMCPGQRSIGSTVIPDDQTDHRGSYSFAWWVNGIDRDGTRNWPRSPLDTYAALGLGATRSLVVIPSLDIVVAWNNPYRSSTVWTDRAFDYINRSAVVRNINTEQTNTHYLKDRNGNYQFFIGGYPFYPASLFSPNGPDGDINWVENLEYSRVRNYNMVRLLGIADGWVEPPVDNTNYPFRRSSVCCAFDGGNKFDLNQLNNAYFQSLDSALTTAESKGQTVLAEFFGVSGPFGCDPGQSCFTNFSNNFWHSRNSLGGANWNDKTQARLDFFNPSGSLHTIQERALNRYLEVVCDHPNVIHQPVNEIHQYTGMENADEFENWIRDKIRNPTYCGTNTVVLLNNEVSSNFGIDRTVYQGITIHAPHRGNGAFPNGFSVDVMINTMNNLYSRNKFIGFDVDVGKIPAIDDYRKGAWTALTTGSGGFIVLYYQHIDVTQSPRRGIVDADLPHLVNFITNRQIKPWEMVPTTIILRQGTATLLAKQNDKKILAYLRNGGAVALDLRNYAGNLKVEWFNPREGTFDRVSQITGGRDNIQFSSPTSGDWVLYINPAEQTQTCSDGTPYNQCSATKPKFCDDGNLISSCGPPNNCGCPQGQTCQANGSCLPQQNQPPTATITQPTQISFTVNTTINYAGTGTDPENQPIISSWGYDISGDSQGYINLGLEISGTLLLTILFGNAPTIYTLKLVVTDSQGLSGVALKNITINPVIGACNDGTAELQCSSNKPLWCHNGQLEPRCFQCECPQGQTCDQVHGTCSGTQSCILTSAYWERTTANVGDQVRLIVNGNNCNGQLIDFVVKESDTLNPDDNVLLNPLSVIFNNNVATSTWTAEWQEDCGGVCNPPEYYFVAKLNNNPSVLLESVTDLVVNQVGTNQPPISEITEPRENSEMVSFETNILTSAFIEYGLSTAYDKIVYGDGFKISHTIFLTDLEDGETYHYKINVKDQNGVVSTSEDRSFVFSRGRL